MEAAQQALNILSDINSFTNVAADRIRKIVNALKSFAHLDEAEFQRVNIHHGIEDTVTLLTINPETKVNIRKDFTDLPNICCRPGQLNQVFMNLLTNALEAFETQGEITIKTRREDSGIVIQISDTGRGISKTDIKHIFNPGFTTKGVGVGIGLGLAICYRHVKDHGGTIEVESVEGRGSTFTVRLPLTMSDSDQGI